MPSREFPTIQGVIADLDGVVYRGDAPIATAVEAFRLWRAKGIPCAFVTNNSTRSAAEFAVKLTRLGVSAEAEDVITSSAATAAYLRERHPPGTKVYAIGARALQQAMRDVGFVIAEEAPDVVVVGLDQEVTYDKFRTAVHGVLGGAVLIGTNPDLLLPTEHGFDPGAGSLMAMVAAATRTTPPFIGKPETPMIEAALKRLGTARAGTVMIGDQASTDIVAGQKAGLYSILVTTGVPDVASATVPDRTVDSLLELMGEGR